MGFCNGGVVSMTRCLIKVHNLSTALTNMERGASMKSLE